MAQLRQHYAIPSETFPELVTIGCGKSVMFAFRCGACLHDFHIDEKPQYCPSCGAQFTEEQEFGKH